ncbi:DUF5009 domain-containing protein [bacterium]|nr:MAG: DUF5009 domain-containing protein [bacterium]
MENPAPPVDAPPLESEAKPRRLASLDAFRGLTVLLMLLVNNVALGEKTPAQLMHAPWNAGATLTDLVFPWFLLCVGTAIPFSRRSAVKRGETTGTILRRILGRSASMFLLGVFLTSALAQRPIFSLGVLQLIALAYLVAAPFGGLSAIWRGGTGLLMLAAYGLFLHFIPEPSTGSVDLLETSNVVRHVNQTYLAPWGLAGLLSTIPTAALVLIGSVAGEWLAAPIPPLQRILRMGSGVALWLGGWLWHASLPMNKALWTPSYILFSAGLGMLVLGAFYLVVDLAKQRWVAYPFEIAGANPLVGYALPVALKALILQVWTVTYAGKSVSLLEAWRLWAVDRAGPVNGGWLYTMGYMAAVWLFLAYLHARKIYVRL